MNKYSEVFLSKKREDKFEVVIKGEREFLYSGWEINQITTHLNNSYYKNELINTIKSELINGTNPEHIWILNESIKLNNTYENIKTGILNLDLDNDLIKLYYLGSPIPLIPNKETYKTFYIFELIRIVYTMSNNSKLTPIKRKTCLEDLISRKDTFNNSDELRTAVREHLIYSNEEKLKKDSSLLQNIDKIANTNLKVFKHWDQLIEDESFDEIVISDSIADYDISKKYFYKYKSTFKSLEKPIICVFRPETRQVEIICIDMIARSYFNEDNARLLETKNISQNSPLLILIGISIGFVPAVIRLTEAINITRNIRSELVTRIEEIDEIAESSSTLIAENERLIEELGQIQTIINERDDNIPLTNRSNVAFDFMDNLEVEDLESLERQFKSKKLIVEKVV